MDALLTYLCALPRNVLVHPVALTSLAAIMSEPVPDEMRDVWFWERSELAQRLRAIGFVGVLSRDGDLLTFVRTGGAPWERRL